MHSAVRSRRGTATPSLGLILAVAALTLLLSPIIAVWAVMLGAVLCIVGLLVSPVTVAARASAAATAIGVGLVLGAAPYFALALFQ